MVSIWAYIPIIAIDRDIETKPNEVYGLVPGQINGHHDREFYEPLIIQGRRKQKCSGQAHSL